MPVVAGAIVPHAPLLLPELESDEVGSSARRIRDAVGSLAFDDVDVLVVVSPHGPGMGSYGQVAGDLDAFGVRAIGIAAETVVVPGVGTLTERVDHGVSVPLRLLSWDGPVGAVGFPEEDLDLGDVVHVERAIESLTERVAVVASANLSAGLSGRAPLTELGGATEAEARLVDMIQEDVGWLLSGARTVADVGSCGLAPLTLMARLFGGSKAKVLAHEAPVGVGYLVAQVT